MVLLGDEGLVELYSVRLEMVLILSKIGVQFALNVP
jgi:hypothetical protein